MHELKVGKLDSDLLKNAVIDRIKFKRPEVLVRAGVGEDCAVMDFGKYECVLSTDPITAAVSEIGRLAVHISCNDIASNGVEPVGILLAVMLPEGSTEEDVETIMEQASEAAAACNVEIIGGHTEITTAVNKPVIVSTAIGRGMRGCSASAENIRVGDSIIMTKTAGLEGPGIIAGDFEVELKGVLTARELAEAKTFIDHVSVVREGIVAGTVGTHGMHDVTEGGVLGAVWEMCQIAGLGAEVREDAVPVNAVTRKICDHYGINFMRLISSGSMIITADPSKKDEIIEKLTAEGVPAAEIGVITPPEEGLVLVQGCGSWEKRVPIDPPGPDELYKVVKQVRK